EFKPVLGCLAVAQGEGLTRAQLERVTGLEDVGAVLRACHQYLEGPPDGPCRAFHPAFAEFLLGDESTRYYRIAPARQRGRIADSYLAAPHRWGQRGAYPCRFLATHLFLAARFEALWGLVDDRNWRDAQMKQDPSGSLLLNDLSQAWAASESR